MRNDQSFDLGYGGEVIQILNECLTIAERIEADKEASPRVKVAALTESQRLHRARWRLTQTTDELTQELIYCRTVLAAFRTVSRHLESDLIHELIESDDSLIDLY